MAKEERSKGITPGEINWLRDDVIRDVCTSRPDCSCAFCVRRNRMESPRDEKRRLGQRVCPEVLPLEWAELRDSALSRLHRPESPAQSQLSTS